MKINDSVKVEKFLEFKVMAEMLKQASNNSNTFQIAFQSILDALSKNNTTGNIDFSNLNFNNKLSDFNLNNENINKAYNHIKSSLKSNNENIDSLVENTSKKYGVDKNLILAVIKQESDFNPNVVSHAGAKGLMQLMPENCHDLGVSDPFDINQNIDAGTRHLKDMLNRYGNCKELALAAYNSGPGRLKRNHVDSIDKISRLPHETRDYVKKVMTYYKK